MMVIAAIVLLPACRSHYLPAPPPADVLGMDLPVRELDTRVLGARPGVRFQQARAITGTAAGRLFVADGAAGSIRVLQLEGEDVRDVMRIGRPGSGAAEFNDVWDVDVLSGLFVVAADRNNGRIQRFDRDGALVELFPLNPAEGAPNPVFVQNAAQGVIGSSEPVAVVAAPNDDLFMVDARSSALYRTDRRRERLERIGERVLVDPIDIGFADGRLLVLDASEGLVLFDLLGTHLRTVRIAGLERIAVLTDGRILGLGAAHAVLFDDALAPHSHLLFRIDAPVRDVFQRGDRLYIVTDTALHEALLGPVNAPK